MWSNDKLVKCKISCFPDVLTVIMPKQFSDSNKKYREMEKLTLNAHARFVIVQRRAYTSLLYIDNVKRYYCIPG